MHRKTAILVISVACFTLVCAPMASAKHTVAQTSGIASTHSILVVENVGQWDAGALFQVWGGPGTTWIAHDGIWISLLDQAGGEQDPAWPADRIPSSANAPRSRVNLRVSFVGANPNAIPEPFGQPETAVSYFRGSDPDNWHAAVPVWTGIRYRGLYPGLDLEIGGASGEWAWQVVPTDAQGARTTALGEVRLRVEGADALQVTNGRINLTTALGSLDLPLLNVSGVEVGGIPGEALLDGDEVLRPFALGTLEPSATAPSDAPEQLTYSTFVGGSGWDLGYGMAVDGAGFAYVAGITESSDFPASSGPGYDKTLSVRDAFVVKLNAQGTGIAYATYLGGTLGFYDEGYAIAVDTSGSAYITGKADSADFPTTVGSYDTSANGGGDAFITKLSTTGTSLVYSTLVGGRGWDGGDGIVVDIVGNAYISGHTRSPLRGG